MSRITLVFLSILVFLVVPRFLIAGKPSLDSLVRSDLLRLDAEDQIFYDSMQKGVVIDSILTYAEELLGTPYRFKNRRRNKPGALNCSQFILRVFGKYGYELPTTSLTQSEMGEEIPLTEIQRGDLLFFSGRSLRNRRIGHVALVLDVRDGVLKMIHASRRGVVIDDFNASVFYQKRFVKACRLDLQSPNESLVDSR